MFLVNKALFIIVRGNGKWKLKKDIYIIFQGIFFELVDDPNLSINHSGVHSRPSYFLVKDKELLWFIPLSSKVEKYRKLSENTKRKYGKCNTILIRRIANKESAILLQNAFPTLPKYLSHPHTVNGKPYKVSKVLQKEILDNFNILMDLKKRGLYTFFTNVDKIEAMMYQELQNDTVQKV